MGKKPNNDKKNDGSYQKYLKNLNEDITQKKKLFANEVINDGDKLLLEIESKNKKNDAIKNKHIQYILNKTNKYDEDVLFSYSYDDIEKIYVEIRNENTHPFIKIVRFLFDIK